MFIVLRHADIGIGSKDRLHRAKTIDLCQNPLTVNDDSLVHLLLVAQSCFLQKEPKLDRARQIPEWEVYDNEIAEFARRLRSGQAGDNRENSPPEDSSKHVKHEEL